MWEYDHNHLARVLVKVRVVDLDDIHGFLISKGDHFEEESWVVQCEILHSRILIVPHRMRTSLDDLDDM